MTTCKTKTNFWVVLTLLWISCSSESEFISGNKQGLITSLGDFNNDKYTDIVTINLNNSVSVWYYKQKDSDSSSISKEDNLKVTDLENGQFIIAAIPGDFNKNNALDLAVLIAKSSSEKIYELRMFLHDKEDSKKLKLSDDKFNFLFNGQPLVADIDGDQVPDFVGQIAGKEGLYVVTTVETNSGKAFEPYEFKGKDGKKFSGTIDNNCAHSFAHVVGDAQPDLIFCAENSFEVWKGDEGKYSHSATIDFPSGKEVHGNMIVIDIDLDGYQELVFPVCVDANCETSEIFYYEIEELSEKGKSLDKDEWTLFHAFSEETQPKVFTKTSLNQNPTIITNNLILRAGDYNFDGYPDFLTVMKIKGNEYRKLFLLENTDCAGNGKKCAGSRDLSTKDYSLTNVEVGTFFDYKEDGGNNLIYSVYENGKYMMKSKDISDKGDSAFLKVMVIGGQCGPGGSGDEDCRFGQDVNYGANLPGPTIEYSTRGSDGKERKGVWTQLSQGTHQAIQSPSVIFGLGQVANFIEKLTITLASGQDKLGQASMENVIPNSQLILIPYPPDKPDDWTFQLLLTPSDIIWKFAIALLAVVVVLGIVIIILQWQEKREDDAEKREEAHKFHFDAM